MKVQLNEAQNKAVISNKPRILCLAGAGTGKTRVLTHRIAYLDKKREGTSNMLALTFTRFAAKEMKERVIELIGESQGKKLFAGTFHGWCVSILKEFHYLLDRDKNFTIYGEEDRRSLIKSILDDFGYSYKPEEVMYAEVNEIDDDNLLRVIQEYKYRLRQNNAFDLDMLMYQTYCLLAGNPEVNKELTKRYKYVFVDEFQDTDDLQFNIIKALNPENLFVVGDDYQSIYAWRGANPQNIIDLSNNQEYEVVRLERNYRSSINIVEGANQVINNNKNRTEKKLITEKDGPEIIIQELEDEESEAKKIGDIILSRLEFIKPNIADAYSEFAVLARTNKQVDYISSVLNEMNIPTFVVSNRNDVFRKYHIRLLLNWIESSINPDDETYLKRIINFPSIRVSDLELEELELKAMEEGLNFYEAIKNENGTGIKNFIELQEMTLETFYDGEPLLSQFKELISGVHDLINYYEQTGLHNRVEDIERMYYSITRWVKVQEELGEQTDIESFLRWIKTKDIQDRLAQENTNAVKLMTIHAAKGLEFPVVFVAGMNQGTFPSKMTENIEEERRLFYVAVTRAKERLILTRPAKKRIWGDVVKEQPPSQFLSEII